MYTVYPDQVLDYFNHVLYLEKAKKLASITNAMHLSRDKMNLKTQ